MKSPLRLAILKRVVMLLGLYEWAGFSLGTYFLGARDFTLTILLYLTVAAAYWGGYELSFLVQHLVVRAELERQKNDE